MFIRTLIMIVLMAAALPVLAQEATKRPNTNWPGYQEDDYIISNYKFVSGESLPEAALPHDRHGEKECGGRGGQRRAAVAGQHRHRRQLVSADAG
jgi:hypothetical protein